MPRTAAPVVLAGFLAGCGTLLHKAPAPPPEEASLAVKKVEEEIVVAAWAEPSHLPRGGGQVQLLVRVQKRGGAPFPGVEVRLSASIGELYSQGQVLTTDAHGMTRDRLTARSAAFVTLNAGGDTFTGRTPASRFTRLHSLAGS